MEEQPVLQVSSSSKIRGKDLWGYGHYQAPRANGTRKHNGIDLVCIGGTIIKAASDGVITKCEGRVYHDTADWNYVEVKDTNGIFCRYFYVKHMDIDLGLKITRGDVIGVAQGIEVKYHGITGHLHFEVKDKDGNYLDPNEYLAAVDLANYGNLYVP